MKVLTAAQMREVDRRTIELGIPGIVLMENAGQRVVEFHGHQPVTAQQQPFGQTAGTGADLDDCRSMRATRGAGDALENGTIEKIMLSQALAHAARFPPRCRVRSAQPRTSSCVLRYLTRTQPAVGRPKFVAGSN